MPEESERSPGRLSEAVRGRTKRSKMMAFLNVQPGSLAAEQKVAGFENASGIAALSFDRRYSVKPGPQGMPGRPIETFNKE